MSHDVAELVLVPGPVTGPQRSTGLSLHAGWQFQAGRSGGPHDPKTSTTRYDGA